MTLNPRLQLVPTPEDEQYPHLRIALDLRHVVSISRQPQDYWAGLFREDERTMIHFAQDGTIHGALAKLDTLLAQEQWDTDGLGKPCEETTGWNETLHAYLRCGCASVGLVYHSKERRAYRMCEMCLTHNVRNRGGVRLR